MSTCCQGSYPDNNRCADCPHGQVAKGRASGGLTNEQQIARRMQELNLTGDDPLTADKKRAEAAAKETEYFEGIGGGYGDWSCFFEYINQPGFFASGGLVGEGHVTFPLLGSGTIGRGGIPNGETIIPLKFERKPAVHDEQQVTITYNPDAYAEIKPLTNEEERIAIAVLKSIMDDVTKKIVESFRVNFPMTTDYWRK